MNIKKKGLALVLALSLFATGCSGDNQANDTNASNSTSTQESSGEVVGKGSAKGYGGDVNVEVTFDGDKIKDIKVEEEETEGKGDEAIESIVSEVKANNNINVDAVSDATKSSEAVLAAITVAIEDAGKDVAVFEKENTEEGEKEEKEEKDVDVAVVGGGGAGFAAAITAKEAGAEVVLLEKMPSVGGNTLISGGEYAAAGNELQEKEGIEDSAETFADDIIKSGQGEDGEAKDSIKEDLIKNLAEKATDAAYWLRDDVGVKWVDELMFFGGHSVKRSLIPEGHSGSSIISTYKDKADELGIEVLTDTDVKEIIEEDGTTKGVRAETKDGELTVNAKSVVLASGGFGANDEMCYEYDKEVDDKVGSTNSKGATGDGITMAEELGADKIGMEYIQLYPVCDVETGKLLYVGDTRLSGGALLVNKEGERFVEELGTRREISMAIKDQTDSVGYLLWDETSNESTGTMASHPEEAKDLYERGLLVKADTIEECAEHFDIDKDQLIKTVETFNKNSKEEKDPDFNLRMLGWEVKEGPFYMLKAAPAVHHTMGGLSIDTQAQVLNKDGEPIEGLYAAGEVTGGIHGINRLGSVAMADITVYGRIAGEEAANFAK